MSNEAMTNDEISCLLNLYSEMRGDNDLTLYVLGGIEGDRTTYVGKISYADLVSQFNLVPRSENYPQKLILQRELVTSRATNIKTYILNNKDHLFPEIISVCETITTEAVEGIPNLFKLTLPAVGFRYLVDGQGRLIGINKALLERQELAQQTIDIKFVASEGISKDSQLFSDVNMTPISPNKSQCAAMDSRLVVNRFAKMAIESVPELTNIIDYTKASVTASSKLPSLWTLNQMVAFVLLLTGTTAKSCEKELATEEKQIYWAGFIAKYFSVLQENELFKAAISQKLTAQEVRVESIIGTSVFLKSLALMGKVLIMHFISKGDSNADWSILSGWKDINLQADNNDWIGRCKNYRGGFEDKTFNHKATASYFLTEMCLEVPEELETIEEEVLLNKAKMLKTYREEMKANNTQTKTEAA